MRHGVCLKRVINYGRLLSRMEEDDYVKRRTSCNGMGVLNELTWLPHMNIGLEINNFHKDSSIIYVPGKITQVCYWIRQEPVHQWLPFQTIYIIICTLSLQKSLYDRWKNSVEFLILCLPVDLSYTGLVIGSFDTFFGVNLNKPSKKQPRYQRYQTPWC